MAKRQLFLDEPLIRKQFSRETLKIINWNVRNPSLTRAQKQAQWLKSNDANLLILTEIKYSEGGIFLRDRLESYGFRTLFPEPEEDDYGALLALGGFKVQEFNLEVDFLPHRAPSAICKTKAGEILITGVYVPSSVTRDEPNGKKQRFQEGFAKILGSLDFERVIICGDLNVLEPDHQPHYPYFKKWEYEFYEAFLKSGFTDAFRLLNPKLLDYDWFGREGNGYRYEHCFVSKNLKQLVKACNYLHEPRETNLSDHSAMLLEVSVE